MNNSKSNPLTSATGEHTALNDTLTGRELQAMIKELRIQNAQLQATNKKLQQGSEPTISAGSEYEEKYRHLFNFNPLPLWIYDMETKAFLEVNDAAINHYGYSREEFLTMSVIDIRPQEDIPKFIERARTAESGKLIKNGFWRHLKKNGDLIHVEITSYRIDYDGRPAALVMVNDITERKKTEDYLRNSELRFRSLIEKGTEIIALHDSEGRILYMSPSIQTTLGYLPEDRIGKSAFDAIHPGDAPRIKMELAKLLADPGGSAKVQWRHRHANGDWHWLDGVATNLLDDPAVNAVVHNFRDITRQKEAENKIILEKELSESIINSLPGIFYLFDEAGKILRWNRNFEKISGYSSEEIGKMQPTDFFDVNEKEQVRKNIGNIFETGTYEAEGRFFTKEGKKIAYFFTGHSAEFENKPCLIGVCIDISERKKAEDATRTSNEKYQLIAKATNDSIWDWNLLTNKVIRDGKKLETLFGYEECEASDVDYFWSKTAHQEDWERVTKQRNTIFENPSESYWEAEYRFLRTNGEYAYVYDRGYIMRNKEGKPIRMIGASQDISELKKSEKGLIEKNHELKQLSAYLQNVREEERKHIAREVHDQLGQLATALKIDIDWLSIKIVTLEEAAKNRIAHANKTIEVLISSVRKLASSLRPSILDDFGLNAALQWQCDEFQNVNGIQCIFESGFDDKDLTINMKTELFRIAQESLTNILRHSKADSVTVSIKEDIEKIYLYIIDNGQGFNVNEHKNTLGLIGLRERALSLDGELLIESQIGKGTTICSVIPKK